MMVGYDLIRTKDVFLHQRAYQYLYDHMYTQKIYFK